MFNSFTDFVIIIKKCAEIGLMDVILVSQYFHGQIKLCSNSGVG